MERQLDAYCAHLRNERQVSPHTLAYRRDLNKVLATAKQQIGSWKALDIQSLRSLMRACTRANPRAAWRACCRRCAACITT
jgi:site-specific recombinase XerC